MSRETIKPALRVQFDLYIWIPDNFSVSPFYLNENYQDGFSNN